MQLKRSFLVLPFLVATVVSGCAGASGEQDEPQPDVASSDLVAAISCTAHAPMTVRFYDVEQGLAALVTLPDGRHILVDIGAGAAAPGCGEPCRRAHDNLVSGLERDLAGRPIDVMWITHQHMDHLGGAPDLLARFHVRKYVENGRAQDSSEVVNAHAAASAVRTPVRTVSPGNVVSPLASSKNLRIRAIVPHAWATACKNDENDCSIGLRIDYCGSSVLFTGDAELEEEATLDPLGPATLVQLGHHGSDTSSSDAFLAKVTPTYAVISAGHPAVGMNRSYCHPRASTLERVTKVLGGAGHASIEGFDATVNCGHESHSNWVRVPVSDRLSSTARDGDVVLVTTGDGNFTRH
jgi:competence protein ComEC